MGPEANSWLCGLASLFSHLSPGEHGVGLSQEQRASLSSWGTEEEVCLGLHAPASQGQVSGAHRRNNLGSRLMLSDLSAGQGEEGEEGGEGEKGGEGL